MTTVLPRLGFGVKWAAAQLLYWLGLLDLWKRTALRGRAVVLTYHRVLPAGWLGRTWSHPGIVVERKTFERHLRLLQRKFRVISLDEFVSHVESRTPFEEPSCLITFDDGWLDTFVEAWPALRRCGLPSVVFPSVNYIGTARVFWQEELARALFLSWGAANRGPDVRERIVGQLAPHGVVHLLDASPETVRHLIHDTISALKRSAPDRATGDLSERLWTVLGEDARAEQHIDTFLDWEQARQMAADGVRFGGHGATHRILTDLPEPLAAAEVQQSRERLAHELGSHPVAFSYPNGDWNPGVACVVRSNGFKVSFSTERGHVSAGDDPFCLNRINVHEDVTRSVPMFYARIVGLL